MKTPLFLTLLLTGCQPAPTQQASPLVAAPPQLADGLQPLPKRYVVGNFDGDQRPDTLYQHVFSQLTKTEITRSPAPAQDAPDSVMKWFGRRQAQVLLTLGQPARDTLHLGFGQGLHCLLNLGDTNLDGRDEAALVVDYLDGSRVNSCQILTFCRGKLGVVKSFSIFEGAFDETPTAPAAIPGFLERRRGRWLYADYLEDAAADSPAAEGQLRTLIIPVCP